MSKFFEIYEYPIRIKLLSGLHIGGGDSAMRVGGTDSEVIKNPMTEEPYIPGSSVKGKIRSLLEVEAGIRNKTSSDNPAKKELPDGSVFSISDLDNLSFRESKDKIETILKLFGVSAKDKSKSDKSFGITRLSFSDLYLTEEFKGELSANITMDKTEVTIDRITGAANPRFIECVVQGVEFVGSISLKVFNAGIEDNQDEFLKTLKQGLQLLSKDYLGGSGSRGYGKVGITFNGEKIVE